MSTERAFVRTANLVDARSTAKRRWMMLVVLAVLGVHGAALADPTEERARALFVLEPIFDLLDCTQQGHIEDSEVDEHFFHLFAPYDPDRKQWAPKRSFVKAGDPEERRMEEALFTAMDSNGDQKVSALEYRNQIIHLIRVADGDGDGEVTLEELRAVQAEH